MDGETAELAIVGHGAVLPGVASHEFFEALLAGKSFVRDLSHSAGNPGRMHHSVMLDKNKISPDRTCSVTAASVDRGCMQVIARQHGLPLEEFLTLEIMAIDAIRQATEGLLPVDRREQTDLVLGVCSVFHYEVGIYLREIGERLFKEEALRGCADELAALLREELERFQPIPAQKSQLLCSRRMERVRSRLGLGGECFLLDAACASSLAALSLAAVRLRQGLCKYVVFGGMDNNLASTELLSSFSRLGVLSEGVARPFDHRSTGLALGEGAAVFLLTTTAEAERAALPVLALVKGIGGSSDGKKGGPTEPTVEGQILSYERAYAGSPPAKLAYVECHGTGTHVGDRVELESLTRFFASDSFPIGTVKYNLGHTMGAAGAMGLLKCLGILRARAIPPSPYFEKFPEGTATHLSINTKVERIPDASSPLSIGISSFGFGGANYHVWLQESGKRETNPAPAGRIAASGRNSVVVCAEAAAEISELDELSRSDLRRLPPNQWPFTDKAQLLAIFLTEKMLKLAHIDLALLDVDHVHVVSGAAQPLDLQTHKFKRHVSAYLVELAVRALPSHREKIFAAGEHLLQDYLDPNDLLFVGSLNNMVASRVSKAFGFRGLNFNVDGDESAGILAVEAARNILTGSSGAAVVLSSVKRFDEREGLARNVGIKCSLLASVDYAQKHDLPIKWQLSPLQRRRNVHGTA